MSATLGKRIEALELAVPVDDRVTIVRFIVTADDPDPDVTRAKAGDVELVRNADESKEEFIGRAEAVALATRKPNCGAVVICWPD